MTIQKSSWIEGFLLELLQTPTQVPLGQTEVLPGDPRILEAVENVLLPRIEELGPDEIRRHDHGDVAARFGPDTEDGVLLQTYIVSQHANLMEDPSASRLVDGTDYGFEGVCALGQGATQNKGPMAAAFAALGGTERARSRPVWLAVNTEGSSSHGGSARVIDDLAIKAAWGIIAFGTDCAISLGNRGRVDVEILVKGASSHSSQPTLGKNPIEDAADVVRLLRTLPLPDPHPVLGPATATPYQFACRPVAPHTIPEEARIVVDRRLLPGEDPARAVAAVRAHVTADAATLDVQEGVHMLPAEVPMEQPVVQSLMHGIEAQGLSPRTFWSPNTFDAGYACSKEIPTVMFGPGRRRFAGDGLTGTDVIPIAECEVASRVLAHALHELGGAAG